jgi:hypothetical protein
MTDQRANIGPIRDPAGLAEFLGTLREQIPQIDDVGIVLLFRSELAMLAIALDTHAAEEAAKRTWRDLQDEPEIVRTFDPTIPWVDPTGFRTSLERPMEV